MCNCKISVKSQAELRHILAHLIYAIRANAEGHHAEAMYEVDQIEGLVFWEDDEAMAKHIEAIDYGGVKEMRSEKEREKLQGKEED